MIFQAIAVADAASAGGGGVVACVKGRPSLTDDQDRLLFVESAGTCLIAGESLFPRLPSGARSRSIAERAHIIGHSPDGPRGGAPAAAEMRSDPSNLILLCPSCHTMIDKHEEEYPVDHLNRLKEARRVAVAFIGGVPGFPTREGARAAVEALLRRARIAFETVGPSPLDGSLPSREAADRWTREVLETVVPSHQMVVAIVEANPHLATGGERDVAERLRLHAADLLRKHSGMPLDGPALRFPQEADGLFV